VTTKKKPLARKHLAHTAGPSVVLAEGWSWSPDLEGCTVYWVWGAAAEGPGNTPGHHPRLTGSNTSVLEFTPLAKSLKRYVKRTLADVSPSMFI